MVFEMDKYEKTMGKFFSFTTYISDGFLVFIMLVVVANVIFRRFFNSPIYGSTEIVCYCSLAAAALGLAQTEWLDGNVRMTLILEKTGVKFGTFLNLIVNIVGTVGFIIVGILMVRQSMNKYADRQISTELHMPMYIVTGVLAAGFILLAVALVAKLILYIMRIKEKNYSIATPPTPQLRKED